MSLCSYRVQRTPEEYDVLVLKKMEMDAAVLMAKKRKNIDLPLEAWKKLSIMAAAQGKSLKAFVEGLLMAKADALTLEVVPSERPVSAKCRPYANPSPNGDLYFEDAGNRAELRERVEHYQKGESKDRVVLHSSEDIAEFFDKL